MHDDLRSILSTQQLFVQQRKEWVEVVIDFETLNKYVILDANKQELGLIAERGGGFGATLRRWLLRSHRPFVIDILSRSGGVLIELSRKFFFFFSDLDVRSAEGERYGSIHRRFGILYKKYDLRDDMGQVFARVKSPFWRLWTFPLQATTGPTNSKIAKKWGGGLSEIFTDADTFMIDYADHPWDEKQRAVIFAAAISIDFDFFENNQGSSGVLSFMDT